MSDDFTETCFCCGSPHVVTTETDADYRTTCQDCRAVYGQMKRNDDE